MTKTASTASHTDETLLQKTPQRCSKHLHDYIKCIYQDESCCADLYEKYKICMTEKMHVMLPDASMKYQQYSNSS